MKTLSVSESIGWCYSRFVQVSPGNRPKYFGAPVETARFKCPSQVSRQHWFCGVVEGALGDWDCCLLLVVEWGIWPSSENWHLYYRLRKSYNDYALLEQAPGHLFSSDEKNDLRSFLQVCVGMGWSVLLLSQKGDRAAFVSHDEWIELASRNEDGLKCVTVEFTSGGLEKLK